MARAAVDDDDGGDGDDDDDVAAVVSELVLPAPHSLHLPPPLFPHVSPACPILRSFESTYPVSKRFPQVGCLTSGI